MYNHTQVTQRQRENGNTRQLLAKRKKSMALVIDLKPGEKILIGEAVITNDSHRSRLQISGDTPILREKDVMKEEDADTPCKKSYFLIQCMYLARNPSSYHDKYFETIKFT